MPLCDIHHRITVRFAQNPYNLLFCKTCSFHNHPFVRGALSQSLVWSGNPGAGQMSCYLKVAHKENTAMELSSYGSPAALSIISAMSNLNPIVSLVAASAVSAVIAAKLIYKDYEINQVKKKRKTNL